jgi:hypothetical protein
MPKSFTQIIEENISEVRKYVRLMERTPMLSDEDMGKLGWKIDKALDRIEKANKKLKLQNGE